MGTANEIVEALPRGRAYLADQLQRAATSIPLNIAEGAGEFSPNDKARFYRMARRSATECAAVLDVCRTLRVTSDESLARGRSLLLRIVSILVVMARRTPRTGTGTGTGTGTARHGTGKGTGTGTGGPEIPRQPPGPGPSSPFFSKQQR